MASMTRRSSDLCGVMLVKPTEVRAASAANSVDAVDNTVAEASAAAIINKFGSKFAAIGSKSKKNTG